MPKSKAAAHGKGAPAHTKASAPAPARLSDREFAHQAAAAAARVPRSHRFGEDRVFIHHAYEEFRKTPAGRDMLLVTFKSRLLDVNRQRLVNLSRADLVEAMSKSDVRRSGTVVPGPGGTVEASFNFIRLPPGR
jgi:hypothetical protein